MITATGTPKLEPLAAASRAETGVSSAPLRLVWRASLCLLGLQLIGMLVLSTVQFERFNLTNDFAGYAQAWTAIAHGHLSPFSSVFGVPFWQDDFELLMWPLAAFYWIYPHAVALLWLQDLAVVAGEVVVLVWAREVIRDRGEEEPACVRGCWPSSLPFCC